MRLRISFIIDRNFSVKSRTCLHQSSASRPIVGGLALAVYALSILRMPVGVSSGLPEAGCKCASDTVASGNCCCAMRQTGLVQTENSCCKEKKVPPETDTEFRRELSCCRLTHNFVDYCLVAVEQNRLHRVRRP
jgi:hypothetical protein